VDEVPHAVMVDIWYWIVLGMGFALALAIVLWKPLRNSHRQKELARLRQDFHREREHLEAKFNSKASGTGKPRRLAWTNCDFEDDVTYARDRRSGELSAFVGMTVHFEAVVGGGMEEVEFVTAPRDATAVFRVDRGKWTTDGRTIMNLNPSEALRHFAGELELVSHEPARS
jgi:hypothetical protein